MLEKGGRNTSSSQGIPPGSRRRSQAEIIDEQRGDGHDQNTGGTVCVEGQIESDGEGQGGAEGISGFISL